MSGWNQKVRLSRFERNGIIVLLSLIVILTLFKGPIVSLFVKDKKPVYNTNYASLVKQIASSQPEYSNSYSPADGNNTGQTEYSGKENMQERIPLTIEINSANVEEFEKLYGIGKVLSARIVKFRDGLGGFQTIEQVNDVYGIEDSTFQNIRPHLKIKPAAIKKININEADLETISKNPYVAPTLAKQFIGYRTKVKPFESVEEIKKLYYLKDHPELYEKLYPYITVN